MYYLLSLCKIFKKFFERIQSFSTQNWPQDGPFSPNKNFLGKIINIVFIYLLAPFTVQNLKKKNFNADPELWCDIFGPKMVHLPKQEFFLEIH